MELQTLFEMEDIAVSESVYPGRPALLCCVCLKMVVAKGGKNAHPPSHVLNVSFSGVPKNPTLPF
jgi:hypothetical protein